MLDYSDGLVQGDVAEPPFIIVEATFGGDDEQLKARFEGDGNVDKAKASGVGIRIELDREEFGPEFDQYVQGGAAGVLPIEYYRVNRYTFARGKLVSSMLRFRSCLIDSSSNARSGNQQSYIAHLAKDVLTPEEQIAVLQAFRDARMSFNKCEAVDAANSALSEKVGSLTRKGVSFRSDMGNRRAWESGVVAALDGISFVHAGAGSRSMVEVELALAKSHEDGSGVILLEEPEAHLSHSSLNVLLSGIGDKIGTQQVIVSTHSSFVANKLGLDGVSIVGPDGDVRGLGSACESGTFHFFEKLPGYATLRLLLCKAAFLVEGECDELVVQRAYMDSHEGRLPIQDGIEVISVGTAAKRFLELAKAVSQPVAVLTDNDGDIDKRKEQYAEYYILGNEAEPTSERIAVSFPTRLLSGGGINNYTYNTLEPELYESNGKEKVGSILGKSFGDRDSALKYMKSHKGECAYMFFITDEKVAWPDYITNAISFIDAALDGE